MPVVVQVRNRADERTRNMDRKEFDKIGEIFHKAIRLRDTERVAYLNSVCARDQGLRREVESLIEADRREEDVFDRPLLDSLDPAEFGTLLNKGQQSFRKDNNMQQIQCSQGHFYDPEEHTSCPHCPVAGLADFGSPTQPLSAAKPVSDRLDAVKPGADAHTQGLKNLDEGPTVGVLKAKLGVEPVVGWLVCVEGPDRGRDYRIRAQRNFIGRDPRMDICISGDDQVSKDTHATLIYDSRSNIFRIAPGDSHGMTYLNNQSVDTPATLRPYDLIEVGATKLIFVPLCGEAFQWQ